MRHVYLKVLPVLVAAGAMAGACSTNTSPVSSSAVDTPDASAPTAATTASKTPPLVIPHSPSFDNHSDKDRAWIFEQMEHMGAVAAGLHPDFDPDNRGGVTKTGRTPFVIGGVDQEVNGLTEDSTQSETSIAVNAAGTILIAGYNDAKGFGTTPVSLSGVARSSDGGNTWAPVLVGPGGAGTLPSVTNGSVFGDPDVKYDPTRDVFFYASIYVRPSDRLQGMSISVSNSGPTAGTTWTTPLEVTPTFITAHAADKEFIDVNTRTGRLLLSWTDFNGATSTGISTTFSDDAGQTWSPAAQPIVVPAANGFVQSSVPRFLPAATNATSTAYVAWRQSDAAGLRNIGCSRSIDGGSTWEAPVNLDSVSYSPEDQILGVDRVATSPSMAIDYTGGQVYVVYQRNNSTGTGDVALRVFTGACSVGNPVILSSNPGADRAQFMPWVSVDQSNRNVHVIWYDNSHEATGDVIEVMHTVSRDRGVTWSPPTPLVDRPFHAGFGNDTGQPNIGDYIQAVAQNGRLHSVWGGTSVAPLFNEGQPSLSLISPDTYYDVRLDTDSIVPLRLSNAVFAETSCKALGNGNIDPGETISLNATLTNYVNNVTVGATTVTGITGTLATSTPNVTITTASSPWADIPRLGTGNNTAPFIFQVAPSFVAGTPIDFILTLTSGQGTTQLPIRVDTGTPGQPTPLVVENFESVAPPALPAGWTAAVGGGAADPWVTSNAFAPMTTQFAFHGETGSVVEWMRLFSPVTAIPAQSTMGYVSLDFDLAYRLMDEPTQAILAYNGMTVRITDQTAGSSVRSVLAEAFAQRLTTGSSNHFPKHNFRSNNASYFQDMSVWSGDSSGVQHVAMRFPANGMAGRSAQVRFEYTQFNFGNCTAAGHAAPCGVGVDNISFQLVPLTDGHCATSDLSITKTAAPEPVQAGGTLTYTLTVTDIGPSAATNIKVADTLPAGVTLVSATGAGWTCVPTGLTVNCSLPTLALAGTSTITIVVTAPAAGGSIQNTATVTADQFDPVTTNNTATATSTVAKCGDGILQTGEQCDDGVNNGTAGDCCTSTCTFRPASFVCRAATDSCDNASSCTGSSGTCPADTKKADGTACTTANLCQTGQTCTAGVCGGGTTTACTNGDTCNNPGACVPATGVCSAPVPKANGTACTTANLCQTGQVCTAGTCGGGTATVCNNGDQCNNAGTCTQATGTCTAPVPKAGGTSCDDGNACTTGDVCTTGTCAGTAKTCTAQDACHVAGTCDSNTGACSNPPAAGGTPCPGGSCNATGVCVPAPVDAGVDSGANRDSGGDAAGDAGQGGTGDNGGCGCRTAGSEGSVGGAVAIPALALPLIFVVRRRRRRTGT